MNEPNFNPVAQAYTAIIATYRTIFNMNIEADVSPDIAAQVAAHVASSVFTGGINNVRPDTD